MSAIVSLLGPAWTVRLINTYYFCYNVFNTITTITGNIATSVNNYMNGTNNRWVFLKDGAGPIPAYMVSDYFTNRIVTWVYDTATNTLYSTNLTYLSEFGDPIEQTVPVLSSAIRIRGTLHDMDTFMSSFTFRSPLGIVPSPRLIMYCWSTYTAKWGIPEDNPMFEFIDTNGDDIRCAIFERRSEDRLQWDRLFDIHESDTSDDEDDDDDDTIEITDEMETSDNDDDVDECDDGEVEDEDMDDCDDGDNGEVEDEHMDNSDDGENSTADADDEAGDECNTESVPSMQG